LYIYWKFCWPERYIFKTARQRLASTVDVGETWDTIPYEGEIETLQGVSFSDANHGIVVGANGKILQTENGGDTWSLISYNEDIYFTSVRAISTEVAFVAGSSGTILKTNDGGNTWQCMHSDSALFISDIKFVSEFRGCAVGNGNVILNTYDAGQTWIESPLSDDYQLNSVGMFNSDEMIAVGTSHPYYERVIMKSTDGGLTWLSLDVSFLDNELISVFCNPEGFCYAVGWGGTIAKSDDFGTTWTQLSHQQPAFNDAHFPCCDVGYAVTGSYGYSIGRIFKSVNGGNTWNELDSSFIQRRFNTVVFSNADTGIIAGSGIYSTYDGGETWICSHDLPYDSGQINSVKYVIPGTAVAVGSNGIFLRSSDNGHTWIQLEGIPSVHYFDVTFPSESNGFALGEMILMKTTDAGLTWTPIPLTHEISSIYFYDGNKGFGVGNDGIIMKTEDGGYHWVQIDSPTTQPLYTVSFRDQDTGYAAGGMPYITAVILKTTDGGLTWSTEPIPTNYPVIKICINDQDVAYACALSGFFVQPDSSVYTNINKLSEVGKISNAVVYPNPGDELTTIRYILSQPAHVVLKIYSINGRELQTVTDGYKSPGTHYVSIDIKHFPQGVYLYRLFTGNEAKAGKIIVK
jgi:photosystem II stability/assembly factor-like uncharacterized protein